MFDVKLQVGKDPVPEEEHHYAEIKPKNQAAEDPVPEEEHHYADQEEHYAEVRGSVGVYSYAGTTNNPISNTAGVTSNSRVQGDEEVDQKLEEGVEVSCHESEYVDNDHIYFNPVRTTFVLASWINCVRSRKMKPNFQTLQVQLINEYKWILDK